MPCQASEETRWEVKNYLDPDTQTYVAGVCGEDYERMKQRLEALQSELDEQCKLHSLGSEREYILLGKIARLERVAEAARKVNQILQDTWARDEIDSFDFQPLNEALDKLGKD
jgi:hypothetical protein